MNGVGEPQPGTAANGRPPLPAPHRLLLTRLGPRAAPRSRSRRPPLPAARRCPRVGPVPRAPGLGERREGRSGALLSGGEPERAARFPPPCRPLPGAVASPHRRACLTPKNGRAPPDWLSAAARPALAPPRALPPPAAAFVPLLLVSLRPGRMRVMNIKDVNCSCDQN